MPLPMLPRRIPGRLIKLQTTLLSLSKLTSDPRDLDVYGAAQTTAVNIAD